MASITESLPSSWGVSTCHVGMYFMRPSLSQLATTGPSAATRRLRWACEHSEVEHSLSGAARGAPQLAKTLQDAQRRIPNSGPIPVFCCSACCFMASTQTSIQNLPVDDGMIETRPDREPRSRILKTMKCRASCIVGRKLPKGLKHLHPSPS